MSSSGIDSPVSLSYLHEKYFKWQRQLPRKGRPDALPDNSFFLDPCLFPKGGGTGTEKDRGKGAL